MIRLYGEKNTQDIMLRLVRDGNDIDLVVVDCDGETISSLIGIQSDGRIVLYSDVADDLGFELDDDGRVEMVNYD
jgi:hypothetical protein